MKSIRILFLLQFILAMPVFAQSGTTVIVKERPGEPANTRAIAPAPAKTQSGSPFIGTWSGTFNDGPAHTIVVESVNSDGTAHVRYKLGAFPKWGMPEPTENSVVAKGEAGILTMRSDKGAFSVTYTVSGTGLLATYKKGSDTHRAEMARN